MTDMVFLATDDGVFALQNGRAERLGLADKSVSAVIRQPDDQNVLHAGVWGDGVYRSTDGGRNWESALEADV